MLESTETASVEAKSEEYPQIMEKTGHEGKNGQQVEKKPSMVEVLTQFWNDKSKDPSEELLISPVYLFWIDAGGQQTIKVWNRTASNRAFKVKCSDNRLYKIHPVFFVVPSGKCFRVVVTRNPGPIKLDKVVLCHAMYPDIDSKDLVSFFKEPDLEMTTMNIAMLQRVKNKT